MVQVTLPLTGTITQINEDGTFAGQNNDPVRPVGMELLGDVSWSMVSIDINDTETMVIDIQPAQSHMVNGGTAQAPVWELQDYTTEEKAALVSAAVAVASIPNLAEYCGALPLSKPS